LTDRWVPHGFLYPLNYGFVPGVMAADGHELDAYVLGIFEPVSQFEGRCIAVAVIHRTNDDDDKRIVVPEGKDYSDEQIRALTEFQERFFESFILREMGPCQGGGLQTLSRSHHRSLTLPDFCGRVVGRHRVSRKWVFLY
jgi:inorganic pyrophosphatase